ncbi:MULTISPECIES: nucleoside triphosphate pyrophosphatase [unclassified Thioalkalivibrio]|uniref:Maf family protein n=1 Tax=unclassified Thioalkalivibrio TaxID=2621013 RepID=UPI00036B6388|nr:MULTISPECIES: Maf family nucleotide pyrophosphatase [unclassified Thioalkalivibrio]
MTETARKLVLASTSPYRAELLGRLRLPFETARPEVDETPRPHERPDAMVTRLAEAKARAVADAYPDHLVIGSDQNASHADSILGKPGDTGRAEAQLAALSGKTVTFHTGLCLLDTASGQARTGEVPFTVTFRELTPEEIHHYVALEQPLDCAGSFKSEGLGISLFARMQGDDPTALVGLPLITLGEWLREAGIAVPPRPA